MLRLLKASYEQIATQNLELWLTTAELQRLSQLVSQRRQRDWLVGRWAAKSLIQAEYQDNQKHDVSKLEIEIWNAGLQYPAVRVSSQDLIDKSISISHTQGHAYAGLAHIKTDGYIGVDIELVRTVNPKLQYRVLSMTEREEIKKHFPEQADKGLIKFWSLKEAAFKCLKPHIEIYKRDFEVQNLDHPDSLNVIAQTGPQRITLKAKSIFADGFYYSYVLAPHTLIASLSQD